MSMTLDMLAERLGATLHANDEDRAREVIGCAPIDRAEPNQIAFLANRGYARHLRTTRAAAVLVDADTECPDTLPRLVCDDPYFAFRNALIELVGFRRHPEPMGADGRGIASQAAVHPTATIGAGTHIHPFAVVEEGAAVGRDCVLYPGVYVGRDATIGDECLLYPNVTVYDRCQVGDRVILHSSTVVGHDGFGHATHAGAHHKIPQTGIAVIEDDVELGAGCAIERAAMGETRIGRGTKFADLISIGHGTTMGAHCLCVSLAGISGSVDVGNYVVIGGQAGIAGHLKIGDGVQIAAHSGVASSIEPGRRIGGAPAIDIAKQRRNWMIGTDLAGLLHRVKALEKQVAALEA